MSQIRDYFYVTVSEDKMEAKINYTDNYKNTNLVLSQESLERFLAEQQIIDGIQLDTVRALVTSPSNCELPLLIAKGVHAKNGTDGKIEYEQNFSSNVDRNSDWNFRDVMRIPAVKEKQKLATIHLPTKSKDGVNIYGKELFASSGFPVKIKAGKHVEYNESDRSFYAMMAGQVSITNHLIEIHDLLEINENVSTKTNNIEFDGSIVINGDVTTGYSVKATGDIKIFGIVEAAQIEAGGTVYISEGFAAMKKGFIQAGEDVHIGYINQGTVHAGNNIYVENSIIHSECKSKHGIFCQQGNIVGGTLSVGKVIDVKDIGNRLNTLTTVNLGLEIDESEQEEDLVKERIELNETLYKLRKINKKMDKSKNKDAKMRVTILRLRNSQQKIIEKLAVIDAKLALINKKGVETKENLRVEQSIYPNVIIAFGKYKYKVEKMHYNVHMTLEQNEIVIKAN